MLFPAVLRAAVISLGIGIAALVLLCLVLLSTEDPCAFAPLAARLLLIPTAILCGTLSARFSGAGGIPSGALGGLIAAAMLFSMGLLLPQSEAVPWKQSLIFAAVFVALAAMAGYFVTHRRPRVRRKR